MQEVRINTEYQDIAIKYYNIKNTTVQKGVVVFFYSTPFDIYFQYFFNVSIFIKYISFISLLKLFLFTKYKRVLFKNIRAPPSGLVSKKIKTGGKNK